VFLFGFGLAGLGIMTMMMIRGNFVDFRCVDELVLLCSGGLDSTILAHLMRGRGRAIVLSYVGSWKDEIRRAHQTARHANLPLQQERLLSQVRRSCDLVVAVGRKEKRNRE
jgi:adenylyl- and sulfurtransferase ThiI